MEGFDISKVSEIYVGSSPVSSIYLGSNKLWPAAHDYSKDYLTFEAIDDTTFTFSKNSLQYSLDDGSTWSTLAANTATPTVTAGNKILWKQTGLTATLSDGIGTFSATGNFEASGNIMSLYYGDNFVGQTDLTGKDYAFKELFRNNTMLSNVKNLILPATTLTDDCYGSMFWRCTSLTTVPELPATTLAPHCYMTMFYYCTSLTVTPELPATTLADYCYHCMFQDCTSLTTAPELSATTLVHRCYDSMFYGCTSLTTAPVLSATTLAYGCYELMFYGCTSLTTAPTLPATTLVGSCYWRMLKNCTNLNYIKMLATDISATNCLTEWVEGVSSTGTFIKDATMTTLPAGVSGIPNGWTVQDA